MNKVTQAWAADVANDILLELEGRSGFDGWWGNIDRSIQREIRRALAGIIKSRVDARIAMDRELAASAAKGATGGA